MKAAKLVSDKLGKYWDRRYICDIFNRNLTQVIASAACYEGEECVHQGLAEQEGKSIIIYPFHTL